MPAATSIEGKLAALADRCLAPAFGKDGVCSACCFAHRVTTRIAASAEDIQTTTALCGYRQKLLEPLLDLHDTSNPGIHRADLEDLPEAEQVKRAFAQLPFEERAAFVTLIESLFERHTAQPL